MFKARVIKQDAFWSQRRIHEAQRDTQLARISRDFCRMIDQSEDVAQASAEIQRMAQAAKHLIRVRYNGTDWTGMSPGICRRLECMHSGCRNLAGVIHHLLLPGRRVCSKIKKAVMSR